MLRDHGLSGCVFDFDGTIVLSEHIHMKAWEDLSEKVSIPLPEHFLDQSVGFSDRELVQKLEAAWQHSITREEIYKIKKQFYLCRSATECDLVPGSLWALETAAKQVPVALATNSALDEVMPILTHHNIARFFKEIHTIDRIKKPKPDPEIYINACRSISVEPQHCLAFEDSLAGCEAARTAGLHLISLGTIYPTERLGPAMFGAKDFRDDRIVELLT